MTTQKTSGTLKTAQVSNASEIGKQFGAGAIWVAVIAATVMQPVTQLVRKLQLKVNLNVHIKHTSQS